MKTIFILFILSFFLQQPTQLKGKYKMEFEEEYVAQNCMIEFKNDTYKRKLLNGKTIKGIIKYDEFIIQLKDNNSDLCMELFKNEIQKDTIFFGTRLLNKVLANDFDMKIYSGKLIRIK